VASSIAVSPPPTTKTSSPLKNAPSQVAQADTPRLVYSASPGTLSHLAEAPVATIRVWVFTVRPLSSSRVKGRFERSTFMTFSRWMTVPNRSAWALNRSISSGPVMASGKPG